MRKWLLITGLVFITLIVSFIIWQGFFNNKPFTILSPLGQLKVNPQPSPKPLLKYTFENLGKRISQSSEIKMERILNTNNNFTSYIFSFLTDARKVSGLVNIPLGEGKFPVIVMLRGYVDQQIYQTGVGTQRAGEYFAKQGYITLAPDFLGYGESDMPPNDVWEERFLRLTTVADLLASVKNVPKADAGKIGIWGHSNGGLLALSVLEIAGKNYPTVLWAPVSQFFPYDILFYTNEFEDRGKSLRKSIADFEKDYDADQYSFDLYLDWIKAPMQIYQGTADPYVLPAWSNNLVDKLKKINKSVEYYVYAGADHNLQGAWETVVQKNVEFFRSQFK